MKIRSPLLTSLSVIVLAFGLSACEREGPAERAGERIDKATERAGEALEREGPAERASEALENAGDEAKERLSADPRRRAS